MSEIPACECPTDNYCPKCHPRWYAIWRAKQADENDVARIVGRDLSPEARRLANGDGWADHARMHPATAADYETRAIPAAWCLCGVVDDRGDGTCGNCELRIMTDDDDPAATPSPPTSDVTR